MGTLIRKPFMLIAVGLVGGLLAAMTAVPLVVAHAAEQASDVEFLDEGWWLRYREPLADVPPSGGVDAIPPDSTEIPRATLRDQTNPYRGEYTRVSALREGEEATEAIAAFGLDPFGIADGLPATILGGTVTFVAAPPESAPQAGDGANGQRNEEGAAMIACLQTEFQGPDFAGNYEERPPHDCDVRSPLEPIEAIADRPAWQLDLAPFVDAWADMDFFSFVLVPDPDAGSEGQFFHVAFPNKMNAQVGEEGFPPPPLADLTYEAEEFDDAFGDFGDAETFDDDFAGGDDVGTFDSGGVSGGSGGFTPSADDGFSNGGGGFDASAPAIADGGADFEADAPETADDELLFDDEGDDEVAVQAPVPTGTDESGTGGFNFGYILLPLLGLGLATTLGYSLSQDPELPVQREGAVSKLMQRRLERPSLPVSTDA
jgi:hypothetical protein